MLTFGLYALLAVGLIGGVFMLAVRLLPPGEQIAPAIKDEPIWTLPPNRALATEDVATVRLPVALRGYRFAETDMLLDRLGEELKQRDELIARLSGSAPAAVSLHSVADAVAEIDDDDVEDADQVREWGAPPQETQLPFAEVEDAADEHDEEPLAEAVEVVEATTEEPEAVEATTEEPEAVAEAEAAEEVAEAGAAESEPALAMWGAPVLPVETPADAAWGPPQNVEPLPEPTVAPPEPTVEPPPRPEFPVASLPIADAAPKRRWWRRTDKPKPELLPVPLGVAPPPNVRPARPDAIAPTWWRTDEPAEPAGEIVGEESVEADMAAMEMDEALDDETPTGVIPIVRDDAATDVVPVDDVAVDDVVEEEVVDGETPVDEIPVAIDDEQAAVEVADERPWWQIPAVDEPEPEPKRRRRWGRHARVEGPTVPVDADIAIEVPASDSELDDTATAPTDEAVSADESMDDTVAAVEAEAVVEVEPEAEEAVELEPEAEAEAEVEVEAELEAEPEPEPEPEPAPTDVHPTGRRRRRRPQGEPPPAVLTQGESAGWWGRHAQTPAEETAVEAAAEPELEAPVDDDAAVAAALAEMEQVDVEPEVVEAEPDLAAAPEPAAAVEPAAAAANGAPVAPSMYVPPGAAAPASEATGEPTVAAPRTPRGRRAGRGAVPAYVPPTYVPPAAASAASTAESAAESVPTERDSRRERLQAPSYVPPTAQPSDVEVTPEPPAASTPSRRGRGRGRRGVADVPTWQAPVAPSEPTVTDAPEPDATEQVDEIAEQVALEQPTVELATDEQVSLPAPPAYLPPPAPTVAAAPPPTASAAPPVESLEPKKRRWRRAKDRPTVDVPLFIPPPVPTVEAPPPPPLPMPVTDVATVIEQEAAEQQTVKLPIIEAPIQDFAPAPMDETAPDEAEPTPEPESTPEPERAAEPEPEPAASDEPVRYTPPQSVAAWEPPANWNRQSR